MITGLWEREMFSGTKGSSTVLSAIEKSFKVNFKDWSCMGHWEEGAVLLGYYSILVIVKEILRV